MIKYLNTKRWYFLRGSHYENVAFFNRCAPPPPLLTGYEHNSKQPQMTTCVVCGTTIRFPPQTVNIPNDHLVLVSVDPTPAATLPGFRCIHLDLGGGNVSNMTSAECVHGDPSSCSDAPTLYQRFFKLFSILPKTVIVPSSRSYKWSFLRCFCTHRFVVWSVWSVAQTKS